MGGTNMLWVYFNYPNSRVTIHGTRCGHVEQAKKPNQRRIVFTSKNVVAELQPFIEKRVNFGANAAVNDMWVVVDLSSAGEEAATVKNIHSLLAERYKRFRDCAPERHCR